MYASLIRFNPCRLNVPKGDSHTTDLFLCEIFFFFSSFSVDSRPTADAEIRRLKKKSNSQNDCFIKVCMEKYDNGAYSRIQFLWAISHSLATTPRLLMSRLQRRRWRSARRQLHSAVAIATVSAATVFTMREVCLIALRDGVALVPWEYNYSIKQLKIRWFGKLYIRLLTACLSFCMPKS